MMVGLMVGRLSESGAVGPADRSIYVTWSRLISGRNIIILSISGYGLGCGFPRGSPCCSQNIGLLLATGNILIHVATP